VPTLLHNFITKLQKDFYASKEEGFPEIGRPQVWTGSKQASGECHAPEEARHAEVRQGREGGTVKSRKQAIAIGLSEARKKGAKVPRKKAA
jgi:hypothetical protein